MADGFKVDNVFNNIIQGFTVTTEDIEGGPDFTISKSGRTLWKDCFVIPLLFYTYPWDDGSSSAYWRNMNLIEEISLSGNTVTVPTIDTYLGYGVYPRCVCTSIRVYYIDLPA